VSATRLENAADLSRRARRFEISIATDNESRLCRSDETIALMRFLGVTETCDLAALYLRLAQAGHEVKISISDPLAQGTLAGMIARTAGDWRAELDWVREAGDDGIILFEAVSEGFGALQDALRRDGYNVIGGSGFGDRLENDRAYAQTLLAGLGFPTAHVQQFSDPAVADAFVRGRPARYVLKFNGGLGTTFVGQHRDGRDVRAMIAARLRRQEASAQEEETPSFIVMEHIDGIEMGVGAYFDGASFLTPACLDWEHKRFFAGDMGEMTGEMGTVATFDRSGTFFERTLKLIEPQLREARHVGYVNLNTIVNEAGIWPLEFTTRFGYPGYAVLDPLQCTGWAELFAMMTQRRGGNRFVARDGFSVGIVLTTPPFPYSRKEVDEAVGLPILFDEIDDQDRCHFHFGEVGLDGNQLVTSGLYGWTMVVTGVGATIEAARAEAYRRASRISIPNARYRLDIGARLIDGDFARLERMGFLASG
jgi:phosphoribosylamine--glycine ligase